MGSSCGPGYGNAWSLNGSSNHCIILLNRHRLGNFGVTLFLCDFILIPFVVPGIFLNLRILNIWRIDTF